MLDLLSRGGLLMIPILLCSIVGTAIIIAKLYTLRRYRIDSERFLERIMRILKKKMYGEAIAICEGSLSPIAQIVKAGILKAGRPRKEVEGAMEGASAGSLVVLEKRLDLLATIAHISPLLGLLGTVTGMIKAFMEVERYGGNVNASILAGGIWEALITTASGLSVAIPLIVFHHFLVSKVNEFSQEMESRTQEVAEVLIEKQEMS